MLATDRDNANDEHEGSNPTLASGSSTPKQQLNYEQIFEGLRGLSLGRGAAIYLSREDFLQLTKAGRVGSYCDGSGMVSKEDFRLFARSTHVYTHVFYKRPHTTLTRLSAIELQLQRRFLEHICVIMDACWFIDDSEA
jgi:hypothetical protein